MLRRIGDIYVERNERGAADMELLSVTMNGGVMQRSEIGGKDDSSKDKGSYKIIRKGDMAYNSTRMRQGANGISSYDSIVSPAYTVLTAKSPICNDYLAAFFKNYKLINEFKKNSQRMTSNTRNLKHPQIETIKVYLPIIEEQERIVSVLATLDKRIAAQVTLIEQLKKHKRGVISALLSSRTNPYHSSKTQKGVALYDAADGFGYGMNVAATVYGGSHKYIRITDIDDNSRLYSQDVPVSPEGQVDEKYRVRGNDILFAHAGASVGKSYHYQCSDGDLYYAGFLIRIHVNSDANCGYVFQNTLTEAYRRWVLLESARSDRPGINTEQYKQYRFLLPPLEL